MQNPCPESVKGSAYSITERGVPELIPVPGSQPRKLVVVVVTFYIMTTLSTAKLKKGKGSAYSIAERRVPELIPVLGSQPAL